MGKLKFERFKVNYIRFKRKEAFKEFDDKYISNQFKINFGKTFEKIGISMTWLLREAIRFGTIGIIVNTN